MLKQEGSEPGKELAKNAPYPDRDIGITEQVYRAAFFTALGWTPGEVAKELETSPHTIYNYRRNKKFMSLVRDLDASAEFEPSLETRLLMRQTIRAASEAIEVLQSQFSETLTDDDGNDTGLPQPGIRQSAADKMLLHLGRMVAAQARASGGGGSDGDTVVVVNVNPMAGVIEGQAKEVTDGEHRKGD